MGEALYLCLIVLWVGWSAQAVLSALKVAKFARLFHRDARTRFRTYHPPAAVIVPFKGIDDDVASTVRSLRDQDYTDYRLLLVVESEDDPAYEALRHAVEQTSGADTQVVVAGIAGTHQGQKVHNQLAALDLLERTGDRSQVWVFADSDAVPDRHWLTELIGPLRQAHITGASTGYRWLIPEHTDGSCPFWSQLASVINSSVACLLGRESFNHAWGGSMAMRVDTAHRGRLRELLHGALTDDYQVTRMCRELGLRIYFAPRCLVPTPVRLTLPSLINFAHRQYLITRVYTPKLFAGALGLTSLYLLGSTTAWITLFGQLAIDVERWQRWVWPAVAIAVVISANHFRASARRRVVLHAFGPETFTKLHSTLRLDRWGTWLCMAVHWLLVIRALFGRTMTWRGIRYRLWAPQRCERLPTD